jgi:predicted nucleotidyltransferase
MYVPNTDPNSFDDVDLMGVCVPPRDYYLGLMEYGSRGTREIVRDPWDVVVYEARKMIGLLANGNPNVLSLLWLDDYLRQTPAGALLVSNRDLFMGKHMYHSYIGYAHGQLKRMTRHEHHGYMGEKRKQLVAKHGYDTKNAAHLIRLLRMGIEALSTGRIVVRRDDAEELLAIKHGALALEEVQSMADALFAECREAKSASILPERPDADAVNALCVEVVDAALKSY